jgi:hypothetical protein
MAEQSGATTPTIGEIIKALTAAQAWTMLVAIATVLGSAFTLGRYTPSANLPSSKGKAETIPVPCYKAKNWPKGVWLVWGHITNDWKSAPHDRKFPQITTTVTFDSSTSYVAQGDFDNVGNVKDTTKNQFRAILSPAMEPGTVIHIRGQNGTGYKSESADGFVRSDGCMITGTFSDSLGQRGTLNYLFERSLYYVDP